MLKIKEETGILSNGTNEFVLDLLALLDQQKSKTQINAQIKELEKSIRKLRLVGILAKGDTKNEVNQIIRQMEGNLRQIKIQAKMDSRQLNREINSALRNVSARDIQLNINSNSERLGVQVRRAVSEAREFASRNPISVNIDLKKEKLLNQLTAFTNKHTKINESSYWLGEAERLRNVISSITNRDELRNATDQLQVFTTGVRATGYAALSTTDRIKGMLGNVIKVGNYFGLAFVAVNKFRQSLNTLKTNDTILVEISKTSEMTKQQLRELGDEAFKVASKFGQVSGNYLTAVQEMARSGYEMMSRELGELSLLAQSAGDMTAEMANNYLLATDAAYKYGGSVDKLTAALDGANYISNKNSASLTDIADGIRVSASFAANAGVAIEELTAAEAAMVAATKRSGSEMGRSFRSIILNLQQVSGEFDGEVIDEEQLKKVEDRCHSLGVELEYIKDGVATLRNPMDILKDLAEVYNSLPDNSAEKQGLISDIGGKYHANALSALLSRWDLYEKMVGEFSQGTGSALEEANKTADSWEGRLNSLSNSFDSFVASITSKDVIKGGVSFLDNAIQSFEKLADTIGAIPVILTAFQASMTALNKNYGITQLYNKDTHKIDLQGNIMGIDITGFKTQQKHFRDAAEAIQLWNGNLVNGTADMSTFANAVVENNEQLKAYLQTTSVEAPASLAGYRAYLNSCGVSTDSLRIKTVLLNSALTLGLSLGIQAVATAVSNFIRVSGDVAQKADEVSNTFNSARSDIDSYKSKVEELQAVLNDSSSSISDVTEARKTLMSIQDEMMEKYGAEKGAIDLITEGINGQADAFDKLAQKQWQEAKNEFNDGGFANNAANFINGYSDNIDRMLSEYGDYKVKLDLSVATTGLSPAEIEEFKKLFEDNGMEITYGTKGTASNNPFVELSGNASEMHEKLLELQEMFSGTNPLSTENFRNYLTGLANSAKEVSEQYKDMHDSYILYEEIAKNEGYASAFDNIKGAYQKYKDAKVSGNGQELAKAAEDYAKIITDATAKALENGNGGVADYFESMYPELKSMVGQWEFKTKIIPDFDMSGLQGKTENDVLGMLQTEGTQEGESVFNSIIDKAKEYGIITEDNAEGIQEVLGLLVEWGILQKDISETEPPEPPSYKDSLDGVQNVAGNLKTLMEVYDDVQDGDGFDWSSILNNDDFEAVFSSAGEAYDNFIKTVTKNPDDITACQDAFDRLATSLIDNSGIWDDLTAETKEATIAMLEENGVVNAAGLVAARLALQEEWLALTKDNAAMAGKKLSETTWEEIASILSEGNASDTTAGYLTALAISKMDVNSITIDTTDDVNQIVAIANAAGASTAYIQALANALLNFKSMQFDTDTLGGKVGNTARDIAANALENGLKSTLSAQLEGAKLDASQFYAKSGGTGGSGKSGKSGSGKSGGSDKEAKESIEVFDFIEIAISRVEKAIERLKTRAEETFRSFTARGREYKKAISNITKEIDIQRKGYDKYMARANSIGLEEPWAAQVRDGSINIADVADDSLKERIKNYKEWYEKALQCQEKLEELQKTQKELAREKIELLITKYSKLLEKLESANKRIQGNIDYKEAWGFSASTKDYSKLNKNAQSQISNIIKQDKKLKELQKTVTKGSEAWHEYNERINSNNESIQSLTKTMAENATASASLAKQNAEAKNSAKDTADEKTDTRLSTASTASRKNSLISSKARNIDARQKNLQAAYAKTGKSRASYGDRILKASRKGVSKKNRKLFTQAIAKVKAGKLIPATAISGIVDAMKTATGREYKALNTLLSYCNYYNANKNAEEENRLNLEMYALTAQEEKKSLRQEQLSNNLDANQSKADRSTVSNAESTSAKNHNLNTQTRQSRADRDAQTKARKTASKDRRTAAGKAKFYTGKTYKGLKNKKLKNRLKKAASAIKSGKKISNGALKAVKEYCEKYLMGDLTYYYNCLAYNEAVENELSAKESETLAKAQYYADSLQAKQEKASNTVSGRDAENELYSATAKNQTTAGAKNRYVDSQISNITKNASTYKSAYNTAKKDFSSAKKKIEGNKSKDKAVKEIKSKYVSKNILIPATYIEKAYAVSNSFGLACENYNEALGAMETAKETSALYGQTAKTEKAALALEKMSNIETEYSHKESEYTQRAARINNAMDIIQAKGYQTSKEYYGGLLQNEEGTRKTLTGKLAELTKSLEESVGNGTVTKFSDEWYEAQGRINDVANAIDEAAVSMAEFKSQIRQIGWDNFDYLQNRVKDVASELSFMVNELSREGVTDDKIGWLTEEGKSTAWLHANSYELYRKQAADYKKAVGELNKELADDPYNRTLLDRRQELINSYRDAVEGAQDEKYAVIDLYEQGYNALSNKLKTLTSEYGELLDTQKDAFEYSDTIADKTKEIAALRKQMEAYAGDMSEETRAKVQGIKVSLEEAEKNLQETQYGRYISDTKNMLSDLQGDFDEAIQAIIDSLSENFGELLEGISQTAGDSVQAITGHMSGIGYTPADEFRSLLNESGITNSVSAMLTGLNDYHAKMEAHADRIASGMGLPGDAAGNTGTNAAQNGNGTAGNNNGTGTAPGGSGTQSSGTGGTPGVKGGKQELTAVNAGAQKPVETLEEITGGKGGTGQANKKLKTDALSYLDRNLKATKAKRDSLSDTNKKFYDKFNKKTLTTKQMKELAKLLGVKYDSQKSSGSLYKKLKEIGIKGFRVGSHNIPYDQLAFLGEGRDELHFSKNEGTLTKVGQGDMVFTNEMAQRLWEISQANPELIREKFGIPAPAAHGYTAQPPAGEAAQYVGGGNVTMNVTFGDMNLPNVTDATSAGEMKGIVEDCLCEIVCTESRGFKCLSEGLYSKMLGRGIGHARLYATNHRR